MINHAQLKAELQADPAGLGYAAPLAAGQHASLAGLLNATTGPGAATIALPVVPRDSFTFPLMGGVGVVNAGTAVLKERWDRTMPMLYAAKLIPINPTTLAILAWAVTNSILTQPQADAIWHRTGSRAEVLFGAGTTIGHEDVAQAMRS